MNRLKIYSDKKCTKEITSNDDSYILQQHTSSIDRDVHFHLYIKNVSDDKITTLKVVNKTNNGVIVSTIDSTINPGEVVEANLTIRISKLNNKKYFDVVSVKYSPVIDNTYDGLSKTKLVYLVDKTYNYIRKNDEHQDVKFKIDIVTPIKKYEIDVLIVTRYEQNLEI